MKTLIIKIAKFIFFTLIFFFCLTSITEAHLLFNAIAEDLEKKVQESNEAIEEVKKEIVSKIQDEKLRQQADEIVKQEKDRRHEIESKLRELKVEGEKIFFEKQKIAEENKELAKRRDDLERRNAKLIQDEKLWSMGFYASLFTVIVVILGHIMRFPTARLERRLLRLQIAGKEIDLKNRQNSESTETQQDC